MKEQDIRAMAAADLPEVLAVERLCHTHPWSERIFRQELAAPLVAMDVVRIDGMLAAFLCVSQIGEEMEIHNVATAPAYRRQGVAAGLLRHALERGVRQGAMRVFLEVREGNAAAIALYRSFGFRVSGRRTGYYRDGEDALLLELSLEDLGASVPNQSDRILPLA